MRRLTPSSGGPRGGRKRSAKRASRPARIRRAVGLGVAAALLVGTPATLWHTGLSARLLEAAGDGALALSAITGLRVQQVLVDGRVETDPNELLAALRVRRGDPLFDFSPADAKARIEALGWVKAAIVERRLPDHIYIRLVERRPLALWQRDGRFTVIDHDGEEIIGAEIERFSDLPHIVGPDAPAHAGELVALLHSEPRLMARVQAASRVGGRRWDIRLEDGIDVRLPERDPGGAWARLARYEAANGLFAKDIVAVDLRLGDRLVVKLSPAALKRLRGPGKST